MTGASFAFVAFGLIVALVAGARHSAEWRRWVLLLASLVFLATIARDPRELLPLAGFLLVGYGAIRWASRFPDRSPALAIGGILVLFVWLKHYAFVPSRVWLPAAYVTVGLSYMLFRLLHLVLEVRGDESLARLPFRAYAEYMIAFNTLVAGPIQLYPEYAEQRDATDARVTLTDVGEALERIAVGLFKTTVLAALFAFLRTSALANLNSTETRLGSVGLGASVFVLYTLFLYCNFSGYIDVVIGVSRLVARRLPENFDRPFSATSFIDFWNRWHITLSSWFKAYVYNPLLLSLMRRFPSRRAETVCATMAFFLTFFLVGMWHGQTTAFLFFGVLQGLGVSVNKLYQVAVTARLGRKGYSRLAAVPLHRMISRGLTFSWFTFSLVWFAGSWSQVRALWADLGLRRGVAAWVLIVAGSSVALAAWEWIRARSSAANWRSASELGVLRARTAWVTTMVVVVAIVVVLSTHAVPALVYADF